MNQRRQNDNHTLASFNDKQLDPHIQEHHEHQREASHSHLHLHSLFTHSHSVGEEEHRHGTEQVIAVFEGRGDRGSRITLLGFYFNVVLTVAKGVAGCFLHSASLLADAGHSLSDLLGDVVTLFCWCLSRKAPSERYPYGFAKIETAGTAIISLLLVGGALGIGFHSYHLLISSLDATLHVGPAQEHLLNITSLASDVRFVEHGHIHAVDPNAAWFAAISVLIKEWLYRITKVVADQENSPVLLANAIHHRSDAYSSLVTFLAIMGTWFFPAIPLDPIGGLLVSIVVLRQGVCLLFGACSDLTDAGVTAKTRRSIEKTLKSLVMDNSTSSTCNSRFFAVDNVRARRSGSLFQHICRSLSDVIIHMRCTSQEISTMMK